MRAVLLAAGVGRRLGGGDNHPPKVLLRFGGKTLLRRHVEILSHLGIAELTIVTGYRAADVERELAAMAPRLEVRCVHNPDYRQGSVVSLWSARERLAAGGDVVLMDGDVLYDYRLMERLLQAPDAACFAMDRRFEPGDEPVKLCLRDGRLVDFDKTPRASYDWCGEWVGFLRLDPAAARLVASTAADYVDRGARQAPCEDAIRDALLAAPDTFGLADITGLPWIEIDFVEDVRRAGEEILPRLVEPEA